MQARGCQSVSANFATRNSNEGSRQRTGLSAALLLSLVLAGCTPMPPSAPVAATPQPSESSAQSTPRDGRAKMKPSVRKRTPEPQAGQPHLYELAEPEIDQQGIASWYGPGFHGRKTANGERFNQYELTAAHPTYEFGTQLCVRSKSSGQAVVVRVNDRGPFVKNRVIDLSKAAAEELDMLSSGVKAVEIYKLDEGQDECPESVLQAQN